MSHEEKNDQQVQHDQKEKQINQTQKMTKHMHYNDMKMNKMRS